MGKIQIPEGKYKTKFKERQGIWGPDVASP